MENKKIRFAVVGAGNFGGSHMRGIVKNSDIAEITAICDTNEEILKKRGEEFGVSRLYTDFNKMIEDGGFDCVCLATPDQIHREHAVIAADAGYHILCEKPLAQSMDDCRAMAEAVERNGIKFMTGQVTRKNGVSVKLKELIDSGVLGEIFSFEAEYAHDYQYLEPVWRKDPVKLRYGIVGGGCHAIELMRWMVGNPEKVCAFSAKKVLTDWPVDDTTMAIMQLPNGTVGKIFCSIGGKKPNMLPISIFGTRGTAVVHNSNAGEIHLYRHVLADNGQHMYPETVIKVDALDHNVAAEIKEMVDCIVNDKEPECNVYEGAKTVAIGLAAIESAAKGGMPVVPDYIEKK